MTNDHSSIEHRASAAPNKKMDEKRNQRTGNNRAENFERIKMGKRMEKLANTNIHLNGDECTKWRR